MVAMQETKVKQAACKAAEEECYSEQGTHGSLVLQRDK